jgi:hypothetical protein
MVKELTLNIPTSYGDISLKKWMELQTELENYKDNEEAVNALILYHLCGLEPSYINGLDIHSYSEIKLELDKFLANTELPLQKIIDVDGIEYGFEPNLSQMSYGAYCDITRFETIAIDKNWTKVMNILYRPIVKKQSKLYTIKPYVPNEDDTKWLSVGMDIHFGALFFFVHLLIDLLNSTLKSTTGMELPLNINSILARSGNLIPQYMNSPMEMLQGLRKFNNNP